MDVAVLGEPEADVLLDLQLLLLDEQDRRALVGRSRPRGADPVLVADRLEDLLDEYPIGSRELLERRLRLHDGDHTPRPGLWKSSRAGYSDRPMRVTKASVMRVCAICERTLLMGEHALRFSPDGEQDVDVC